MKKIDEDIYKAMTKFGYFPTSNDRYFNFIYPFTTENINGYLSQLKIKDKDILTVCGSGDHVLNLILYGAKSIDTFDINSLTKYYLNLKIAAVKALEYEEFLEYFCYKDYPKTFKNNNNSFNIKYYWKISEFLDKYTKIFWDNLYLELNGINIRKNDLLFSRDEDKINILKHSNYYLTSNNYYKLKNILINNEYDIKFYNNNIIELPNVLENKYDLMLLSNISQYIQQIYNNDNPDICIKKYKDLIDNLSKNLNIDGKILMGYFYSIYNSVNNQCPNEEISCIYNFPKLNKIFENELEYLFFNYVKDYEHRYNDIKDAVAIYKKVVK